MFATGSRLSVAKTVLRGLPIPASAIPLVLKTFGVKLESLDKPLRCRDRWNTFTIEIEEPTDAIQQHILLRGFFEFYETSIVRKHVRSGNTFLDIGANIGWFTLLACSLIGPGGRVLSFEPAQGAFRSLKHNLAVNNFQQATVFNEALGAQRGTAFLYAHETGEPGSNSMFAGTERAPLEAISVRNGDETLEEAGITHIDFCKIDVEGAECEVLKGLSKTLAQKRIATLMIECNADALGRAGSSPDELFGLLKAAGFRVSDVRAQKHEIIRAADLRSFENLLCQMPTKS
jgi:FkbM family methyltransferase